MRVPRELAEQVEAAMPLLGLANHSQAVIAALRILRRHARETDILAAVDAEDSLGEVVPDGAVTAGLGELLAAEDASRGSDQETGAGATGPGSTDHSPPGGPTATG